jgi:pimeloyl-ACP methyl ester carboxylesterase
MSETRIETGFAEINHARIYYEVAGNGQPFVMIHAGVADSRQWNNEFASFSSHFRVLRYDLRGYGKSEPVDGEFSHLQDLTALLDHLRLDHPLILMGCSMGGGLAMNFALTNPGRAKALIMVDSGPTGLQLDVPNPPQREAAEQAYKAGDLDRVAELETQVWFDGMGRTPAQVNQAMRSLAYEMNRTALDHDARQLGKQLPDTPTPAVERLNELHIPVLVIAGAHDIPYIQTAADYMLERIPSARKVIIEDAAHLPNLDHPEQFQRIVSEFLDGIGLSQKSMGGLAD